MKLKTRTGAALERRKKAIEVKRTRAMDDALPSHLRAAQAEQAATTAAAIGDFLAPKGDASVHMFEGRNIRVVEIDGAPWFVAVDVCEALGLDLTWGTRTHLRKLDKTDKRTLTRSAIPGEALPIIFPPARIGGGAQVVAAVSEAGLYTLVMRSDKEEAVRFQKWVTGTVLPSIRKDGGYVMGEEKVLTGEMTLMYRRHDDLRNESRGVPSLRGAMG